MSLPLAPIATGSAATGLGGFTRPDATHSGKVGNDAAGAKGNSKCLDPQPGQILIVGNTLRPHEGHVFNVGLSLLTADVPDAAAELLSRTKSRDPHLGHTRKLRATSALQSAQRTTFSLSRYPFQNPPVPLMCVPTLTNLSHLYSKRIDRQRRTLDRYRQLLRNQPRQAVRKPIFEPRTRSAFRDPKTPSDLKPNRFSESLMPSNRHSSEKDTHPGYLSPRPRARHSHAG